MSRMEALRTTVGRLIASRARPGVSRAWWRAKQFWVSVRPRTRREATLGLAGIGAAAAALAIVFFAGAMVLWSPYVESVVRPDGNPRTWAALTPTYAGSSLCPRCHAVESTKASTAAHAGIGCESCHGALGDHALASPGTPEMEARLAVPKDQICTTCHVTTEGRPATVRQIVPADHYVRFCLQCHDPHSALARRPPVVLHPRANLPPCVTCHGPDGFKARNQRHPTVASDELCLDCHASGRGPEDR